MRSRIFVSHANTPRENEFALWLALQLAKEGYSVWCDQTMLLGGEHHWVDIETAINSSVKFLYVLSDTSNVATPVRGTVPELEVAKEAVREEALTDFIIPLQIEELSYRINILLKGITIIDFHRGGWAQGLAHLIQKLERDNAPKTDHFSADSVTSWWQEHYSAERGVQEEPETYLSSWFPIMELPKAIHHHQMPMSEIAKIDLDALPYPAFLDENILISFAKMNKLIQTNQLYLGLGLQKTNTYSLDRYLAGETRGAERRQARDAVYRLFRMAWEQKMNEKPLKVYLLSGDRRCDWFPKGYTEKDRIYFEGINGRTWRQLWGRYKEKHWHFGLSTIIQFEPILCFVAMYHILFSDDGQEIWDSTSKLHRARRSLCQNWWNDKWRDLFLASMSLIADGEEHIELPLAGNVSLRVRIWPVEFNSPVSYSDPDRDSLYREYQDEFEDEEEE